MATHSLSFLLLLLNLLLCTLPLVVESGCYKEGKRPAHVTKQLSDAQLYKANTAKASAVKSLSDLPKNFDWCNINGKSFCSVSWNQHIPKYCGACWIHGALGAANDRIKIQLGGFHDNNLARQVILNCGESRGYGTGCDGGESFDIFEYMHRYGLPDETCQNYVAEESPTCNDFYICHNCMPIGEEIFPFQCWAVKPPIMYRVKEYGTLKGEAAMMSEIIARGPITCGFVTTDEFDYNYRGGIYIDRSNSTDVNHDVEVVGWGEENGVKYWKARNSWGTYWGENGFFRILRGVNNALFEDECVFALFDTSEVQNVVNGKAGGSMYGIYDVHTPHRLPTPVDVTKYGEDSKGKGAQDTRVYDVAKKNAKPQQGNVDLEIVESEESLQLAESGKHSAPKKNDAHKGQTSNEGRLTGDQIVQIVKAGTGAIADIVTGAEHMAENVAHPAPASSQTLMEVVDGESPHSDEGKPHHHHGHSSSSSRSKHHENPSSSHHSSDKSEQGEQSQQQKPWTADDVVKVIQAGTSGVTKIASGGASGSGDGGAADGKGSGSVDGQGKGSGFDYSKYSKIGQEYADKFAHPQPQAAQGTQLDDNNAATDWAKKYGNIGDKYADKFANSADQYSDKYADKYANKYSSGDYQKQYSGGGDNNAQQVGAKANVDEIKAAGKLSGQFMPKEFMKGNYGNYYNGNNNDYSKYAQGNQGQQSGSAETEGQQHSASSHGVHHKSAHERAHHAASTQSDTDSIALRKAIVNAFVDPSAVDASVPSHSDSHDEEQERATEQAIRDAIDAAFRSESADAKAKADKIHAAIVDAIADIKSKLDEQHKSSKTQAKRTSGEIREEIDQVTEEIKKAATELEKNTEQNAKDLEAKIEKLQQRQKQLEEEQQQQQNEPQQLLDLSSVGDGVSNKPAAAAMSWSVIFLLVSCMAIGSVLAYKKWASDSYQSF